MITKLVLTTGIVLSVGLLFGIFLSSGGLASETDCPDCPESYGSAVDPSMQGQILNDNAASVAKIKNKVINKKLLNEEREAAAKRIKEARESAGLSTLALPAGMDPGGLPHYYGPYPNYANSPMPTGAVTGITITSGGSGYTAPGITISDVYNTGSGATATATVVGGIITAITITSGGSGYTYPIVTISDTTGTGATATATRVDSVTGITLTNGGTGYSSAPAVTITGDGTGATATAAITTDAVASIALTIGGSGYTAPAAVITGGGGSGATATASGAVDGIILSNGGSGYTTATVGITGDGTGATATATVTTDVVTNIALTTGGSGYTAPAVVITGGGGTGATATASGAVDGIVLSNGGSGYTTATVDITGDGTGAAASASIDPGTGAITGITVTNGGSGYTSAPTVTITGDGAGAMAAATLTVTTITVTSGGSGYTTAPSVTISDLTGTGTGASATAIVAGTVTGITVTNGGSGYTSAPTITISGDGAGATAAATLTVTTITVTSGGSGYTSAPAVTISDLTGTGTGASATAIVAGTVTGITITNGGSGYTTATIGITGGGGTGAAATATISSPLSGGIRKFVDSLPGLGPAGANNLGQYIPIAVPEPCTYSGQAADCYEIELREYTEKMHSDLPPTKLRGYVQVKNGIDVAPIHYLGPLIIAKRDMPVRIKFTNKLPTGAGGDLFLPVDTTIMGSGPFMIDDPANPGNTIMGNFTQNRATIHLHGGFVPWISDGTPHQWITPANETTAYPRGVSVYNVPDMPDPGNGSMTFYYNNQQSARLQFYHDHSYGITRLNVYAGEAAGYLLTDQVETDMIDGTNVSGVNPGGAKILPDVGIPLIIQDKTFVDAGTIAQQDPTWNWGTGTRDANGKITGVNTGDLWLPHVYMPNQNPSDPSGMNAFGRWHYSPWFFPAPTDIMKGPIPNPYCLPTPGVDCSASTWPMEHTLIPAVPNPSFAMEAFMDTPIVNGAAYPNLTVEPKAYRFRILNAANDRFLNLQMYVADPAITTVDGRANTEVKMVPAVPTTGFPANWPIDGREGGVPDPATAGPSFIQIGSEGGFLPAPVVLSNQPVDWNMDQTNFDMGVVNKGTLILGTAERADVIVDFSAFAGKTIILYNDAPAPFPAIDARYDYYTGIPDLTGIGGAPSVLAGYGPNTRTIMQIRVNNSAPAAPYDIASLQAVFAKTAGKRGVFEVSQDEIIVQQKAYQTAYDKVYPNDKFVGINDKSKIFLTALGTPMNVTFNLKAIHDEASAVYSVEDGRMSAMLGLTQPGIPGFIPIPFIAPPVELIKDSVYGTPLGSMGDGTQIWKITHNGVDTHTIHFHLFNIQLINRVAWDNAIRKADPNEIGWKETLRVNPLQDTIVALRPVAPTQPFKIPNSKRLIDPTMPAGFPLTPPSFGWKDPNGNPVTVLNNEVNFGWEYMYHCHLLGHEEMDMMHEVSLAVAPDAPIIQSATLVVNQVTVNWTDNSISETGFIVQRNTSAGAWITLKTIPSTTGTGTGALMSYVDKTVVSNTTYNYRVLATNVVGDTNTAGFPTISADSAPSTELKVTTPFVAVASPTNLTATINGGPLRIVLTWTDSSNNENSFLIWRSVNGGAFTAIGTVARTPAQRIATGGTVTFTNTNAVAPLVAGSTYDYYVTAFNNTLGSSFPSNIATVLFAAPADPSGLTGTAVRIPFNNAQDSITLAWTDNANNENNFQIQVANNPAFTGATTITVGANLEPAPSVVTFTQNAPRPRTYYFRVRATNFVGNSAWNVFGPLNAP